MSIINAGPSVGDLVRISHGSEMELLDAKFADDGIKILRDLLAFEKAKSAMLEKRVLELTAEIENAKKTKFAEVYEMPEINSTRVRDVY
jgi:hypothetical protein